MDGIENRMELIPMDEMNEKLENQVEEVVEKQQDTEEVVDGVHNYSRADRYVKPTEPAVLRQLEWFQDQKFALMMHWGMYSQIGLVESWALSDQDADWSRG